MVLSGGGTVVSEPDGMFSDTKTIHILGQTGTLEILTYGTAARLYVTVCLLLCVPCRVSAAVCPLPCAAGCPLVCVHCRVSAAVCPLLCVCCRIAAGRYPLLGVHCCSSLLGTLACITTMRLYEFLGCLAEIIGKLCDVPYVLFCKSIYIILFVAECLLP